jgi:HAD superfamily hydrolase (TIGR01490 family)
MSLTIFDLDNTLLNGDSDYLWGQFLAEQGIVDGTLYEQQNQAFYEQYKQGTLDIHEFLSFALKPLSEHPLEKLYNWRDQFMQEKILPIILDKARELIEQHRQSGNTLMIITATNRFVTQPIAENLGIPHLLATDPEKIDNCYTGRVQGTPCFQEGKVTRLQRWLTGSAVTLDDSWFYSDSHNDLPLLEIVTHPVAVDPDEALRQHASSNQWDIISLRE